MGFDKGSKKIEKAEKAAQEARKAAFSDRVTYFRMEEDETVYIRLLTPADGDDDAWIHVAQHSGVKTKKAPADAKKWPGQMSAVCRYDAQIKDILGTQDCYVCDKQLTGFGNKFAKPTPRVWALAVMRHQVRGDGSEEMGGRALLNKVIGYDDVREEYEELDADGKPSGIKKERPQVVLINMSWGNFFATLAHAHDSFGSACDRDFAVRRTGKGTDTEYHIMPMDPVPGLAPGTEKWARYEQVLAEREIDLEKLVLASASDEHYARWFDPTKTVDKEGKVVAVIPDAAAEVFSPTGKEVPDEDMSPEDQKRLETMRARLQGSATS